MPAPPVPITSGARWLSRAVVVNHDTGAEIEVGVNSASVTVDRSSNARRTVSAELTPDVDPALLAPPHRLKLYAGYRVNGTDYWASLAHVRFGDQSRGPRSAWKVQGASFETLVAAARFREPRWVPGESSLKSVAWRLIQEAVPWAEIRDHATRDALTPVSGVIYERDRLEAIVGRETSIMTALGVDFGCDADGAFVIRDMPGGTLPTWEASEGGLLVDYSEKLSVAQVRNSWVVVSDHPDTNPVRGYAMDTDPNSPTRVARWGEATDFLTSPILTDLDQANTVAAAQLAKTRGLVATLEVTTAPNPWADITETVAVKRDGQAHVYQLDRITHSLKAETLTASTSAREVSVLDA